MLDLGTVRPSGEGEGTRVFVLVTDSAILGRGRDSTPVSAGSQI